MQGTAAQRLPNMTAEVSLQDIVAASIRAAHPEYTPEEFRAALAKRIYGDDIAGKLRARDVLNP